MEKLPFIQVSCERKMFGLPDPTFADMEDREVLNARREIVQKHVNEEDTVFTYVYDFGDDWQRTITLVKIDSSTASVPYRNKRD